MITNTLNAARIPSVHTNPPAPLEPTTAVLPRQKSSTRRNHHEVLIPGLPYNAGVERYVSRAIEGFKTASQSTSQIIRDELKKRWGKDIDPDNTFIATFNYDPKKPRPRGGKMLNQISLTDAALHNMRHKNKHNEHQTPDEKKQSTLHNWINRVAPLAAAPIAIYNIVHTFNEPNTYEGIFVGPQPGARQVYNTTTQLQQTPAAFRDIVWQTELSKPYTEFLNGFWPAHEQKYAQLSKASFVGAAMAQFDNDSLSENDVSLAMRAAGLPVDKTWAGMTLNDLDSAPHRDPNVETGLLNINGFKSTDLLYITDKKTKTTLLHIPGNSSPIHRFDSQEQMKGWLAEQAGDPNKREALSMHFALRDQADRALSEGVNQTLIGISGWPKKDAPGASVLERLNEYDPQTFITTEPLSEDPFKAMTTRQKARSYADAETQITTDADVTKTSILEALETATKIAVMMTPLALVMPEVAVALEVFYAAAGAAQVGIGADNIKHGKQGGSDQVVFGVLNALPGVINGASKLAKGVVKGEEAVNESIEATVKTPAETPAEQPISAELDANRIRPTQAANISAHAVPDGEQLIEGATRNTKGMYQLKDNSGADRWFIRYTDASGTPKIYEIKSDFKLRDDYVQIIDPITRKPVMTVHATGDGDWARGFGPGGTRSWPWSKKTPEPTPATDGVPKIASRFSDQFVEADGSTMKGSEIFDKYVNIKERTGYTFSSEHYEEGDAIKRRLKIDWAANDGEYSVSPTERATPTKYGSGEYGENFIKDLHRSPYTLRVGNDEIEMDFAKLKASLKNPPDDVDLIEQYSKDQLAKFEHAVPDPELRARISEVAHQGGAASTWAELGPPVLKSGYMTGAGDRHYLIEANPASGEAQVTITAKWKLIDTDSVALEPLNDVQVQSTRIFKIRRSNDVIGDRFKIEGPSPSHIQMTVG